MITTLLAATDTGTGESVASVVFVIGVLAVALAAVVLFIAALVSVVRSRTYAAGGKAIWALLILAFPFLGPVAWFLFGRKSTLLNPIQYS
ncbi:PLD nuclease N-terminal domain-containing protein [Nocardia sp. CDC160]|uniref:PLD nuclease N-terminal domain-containing protein n=1 Tax=Nocardia sp. CDC160 TaxID=3112166 RepID=UPI002DB95E93|nr:PLD nuclease N-terminal domain-containing protein [Nocardia sp. CDC160]MEC3918384.1 PLD nuclease N-terminal domain-containing protein [Nocardia sp. CDC160]